MIKYFRQNTEKNKKIKYPSKKYPYATVYSSGCGVCVAGMLIHNMTTYKPKIKELVALSIKGKARVDNGTDMQVLLELCKKYGLKLIKRTNSATEVIKALKEGHRVVANIGHLGILSSGGHYVFIGGLTKRQRLAVFDPYYYKGKWGTPKRKKIVLTSARKGKYYINPYDMVKDLRPLGFYIIGTKTPDKVKKIKNSY